MRSFDVRFVMHGDDALDRMHKLLSKLKEEYEEQGQVEVRWFNERTGNRASKPRP